MQLSIRITWQDTTDFLDEAFPSYIQLPVNFGKHYAAIVLSSFYIQRRDATWDHSVVEAMGKITTKYIL